MKTTNHPNRSKRNPSASRNPTREEVQALRESKGLSRADLAKKLHVTTRNVEQWESDIGSTSHRRMSPALWELMQLKLGAHPDFELVKNDPSLTLFASDAVVATIKRGDEDGNRIELGVVSRDGKFLITYGGAENGLCCITALPLNCQHERETEKDL